MMKCGKLKSLKFLTVKFQIKKDAQRYCAEGEQLSLE